MEDNDKDMLTLMIKSAVQEALEPVKIKLNSIENIVSATTADLERRVSRMEDSHTWLWRTAVGAIIIGIINIVLKK